MMESTTDLEREQRRPALDNEQQTTQEDDKHKEREDAKGKGSNGNNIEIYFLP
jgi:hypothetical protein